jgi:hypothetical protein
MTASARFLGRSFRWGFLLCLALFALAIALFSIGVRWGVFLTVVGAAVPAAIQITTGHALNGLWVAKYPRAERPGLYWVMVLLSVAVCVWFFIVARSFYMSSAVRVAS